MKLSMVIVKMLRMSSVDMLEKPRPSSINACRCGCMSNVKPNINDYRHAPRSKEMVENREAEDGRIQLMNSR